MKDFPSFDEYQRLALRTLNNKTRDMNIVHCAMGMSGEAGEVAELESLQSTIGLEGELGDCSWYAAVCAEQVGMKFSHVVSQARALVAVLKMDSLLAMVISSSTILEGTKKHLFYGKPIDTDGVKSQLPYYVAGVISYATMAGLVYEEVVFKNINKLAARYPEKFDSDRAINRDYAAESEAAGTTIV